MKTLVRLCVTAAAAAFLFAGIGCGDGGDEGKDDAGTDVPAPSDIEGADGADVLAPSDVEGADVPAPSDVGGAEAKTCADQVCGANAVCDEAKGECVCLDGFVMQDNGDCMKEAAPVLADLEDLTLPSDGFWNGSDGSGGFESGVLKFHNDYNAEWAAWNGFAYSSMADTTTPGFDNQYSAITGKGAEDSKIYATAYDASGMGSPAPTISFAGAGSGFGPSGVYVTNATYPYLSMKDGDAYAKKFGGESGTDPDWFLLTITGLDGDGKETGTVEFYLADFRSDDSAKDYIVSDWTLVDLTSLGVVAELRFTLSSSDMGEFGMNTPAYFVLDQVYGQVAE